MNLLDWFIFLFLVGAVVRGVEVGFIQQFFSTTGFFMGLLGGAWLDGKIVNLAHSAGAKAFLTLIITLTCALVFMGIGEYIGWRLKAKVSNSKIANKTDRFCGALLAVAAVLGAVWIGASIFRNSSGSKWQQQISSSHIVSALDSNLPSAPNALTKLGRLIDPNNFPQVFTGLEPKPQNDPTLPDMGELNPAVEANRASVVKIESLGCGGTLDGSGFVAANNLVVTNAHVVAGISKPTIADNRGNHRASVVIFDPNLDIAILRASNLAGKPLGISANTSPSGTSAAALGYPGGGGFTATPSVVLDSFLAIGRNIYNQGETTRSVYSIKAGIQEGNSGGPLIAKDGSVIGVIFAKSTTYDQVGYAITGDEIVKNVEQAKGKTQAVSTGSCTE